MKILLDEGVPAQVLLALPGHEVVTAQQQGWGGRSNGDLLSAAEQSGFDCLIIADKNLRYQQNLRNRRLAILELWTNHRPTLEKYFPLIKSSVDGIAPGVYRVLKKP